MNATPPTIRQMQQDAGATFLNFGPPPEEGGVEIAEQFGQYPAEYAAIRQRVGVMHLPQRAILRLTGNVEDRKDFLHRMVTQDIQGMAGGETRRGFQLNEKGRIVADLIVHHGDEDTWLEMDRLDVAGVHELLDQRHFAEDIAFEDFTEQRATLALIGPAAVALLQQVHEAGTAPAEIARGQHHVVRLAGVDGVTAYRWDDVGEVGLRVHVPREHGAMLYAALLDAAGYDPQADAEPDAAYAERRRSTLRGRPVGWLAYNTARIEAGEPLFHVDFGRDSLPAETAILERAVHLEKGCYLGQEIVARMHNLGHPKRVLVGLKMPDDSLPIAGSQVFGPPDAEHPRGHIGDVVGGVTSSTVSPMLGQVAIAFAVVKWGNHQPGTVLQAVSDEGETVAAEVQGLNFLGQAG